MELVTVFAAGMVLGALGGGYVTWRYYRRVLERLRAIADATARGLGRIQ